jgi:hypothetical protein
MLRGLGFSLQANAKVTEGRQHADRDAQFGYLNAAVVEHLAVGAPVLSVDTKKVDTKKKEPAPRGALPYP